MKRGLGLLCVASLLVLLRGSSADDPTAKEAPAVARFVECRWAAKPIQIDGIIDEKEWQDAVVIKDFVVFWEKRTAKTATSARLLWDEKYLYYCAEMEDHDLFAIVTERNGLTWNDDVFELFFKPSAGKDSKFPSQYYEFQVNAANTQLELFLPSRGSGGYHRFAPLSRFGMTSAVKLRGTLNNYEDRDVGWTVEGRIPWSAFKAAGGKPASGAKWGFALCRYDYSVEFERPELSSTAPLTQMDFHRYEDYGELIFVGPK